MREEEKKGKENTTPITKLEAIKLLGTFSEEFFRHCDGLGKGLAKYEYAIKTFFPEIGVAVDIALETQSNVLGMTLDLLAQLTTNKGLRWQADPKYVVRSFKRLTILMSYSLTLLLSISGDETRLDKTRLDESDKEGLTKAMSLICVIMEKMGESKREG